MTIRINSRTIATMPSIISINTKLARLRNSIGIKQISGRAALAMSAKITGCNLKDLYEKTAPPDLTTDVKTTDIEVERKISSGVILDKSNGMPPASEISPATAAGWDQAMSTYKTNIQTIDIRPLDIPLSMLTISGELRYMPAGTALFFMLQKRIPVFFLTQLEEKGLDYRIKMINEGEVDLLIFKA